MCDVETFYFKYANFNMCLKFATLLSFLYVTVSFEIISLLYEYTMIK